jgi:hypothetical protein
MRHTQQSRCAARREQEAAMAEETTYEDVNEIKGDERRSEHREEELTKSKQQLQPHPCNPTTQHKEDDAPRRHRGCAIDNPILTRRRSKNPTTLQRTTSKIQQPTHQTCGLQPNNQPIKQTNTSYDNKRGKTSG